MSPSTFPDPSSSSPGPDSASPMPPQVPFQGRPRAAAASSAVSRNPSSAVSNGVVANGAVSNGTAPDSSLQAFTPVSQVGRAAKAIIVWERWALIALLLLGGGYGLWQWLGPKPQGGPGGPPGGGPPAGMQGPPPRPVVTTLLRAGVAGEQVRLLGQVESGDATVLRSQAEGVIEELLVIAGDRIDRGDAIATLDDVDQRLALAEAQADLTQAKAELAEAESNLAELKQGTRQKVVEQRQAVVEQRQAEVAAEVAAEAAARDNLKRIQQLVQEGALSERLLVEAQANLDSAVSDRLAAEATLADAEATLADATAGPRSDELDAEAAKVKAEEANIAAQEAAVAQALLSLQRTRVTATAPGVVNDTLVNVGDYIRSADPVLELIDNSIADILLELPEARASQIQPGQAVVLVTRALPGWQVETTIDSLTPIASATSRSRAARIRLNNPPPGLLPGTALIADLSISGSSNGYQVSRDVLTRRSGEWLVYAISASGEGPAMAQEIPVTLISDNGESVVIDSPELRPNLEIVLKGGDALSDAAPVMVVEGPSAGPPPGASGPPASPSSTSQPPAGDTPDSEPGQSESPAEEGA